MGVMLTTIKAWFTAQKVLQMRERVRQEAEETARILTELESASSPDNPVFHRRHAEDRLQFLEQEMHERCKEDPDHPRVLFIRKELADLRAQLKSNET
jgi:prolyl oligopeptidase PreP (S9A serine peptidase family)